MGDVSTHARLTHFVAEQLKAAVPASLVPHDHYTYLELGNYLTDVSQFRDPPAHHGGRVKAHQQALWTAVTFKGAFDEGLGVLLLTSPVWVAFAPFTISAAYTAGLLDWTRTLFGREQPASERHGALAEFFRRMSLGIAHQAFTREGHEAIQRSIRRRTGLPVPVDVAAELAGMSPLSAASLDAVHERFFTQYWPHEHLDFPYVEEAEDHREQPWFTASARNVLTYLEVDIEALAQQFAQLERDWVRDRAGDSAARTAMMVRLGHLLHAVEDYWFHSNFVELYRWGRARLAHPDSDPASAAGHAVLLDAALADGGVATSVLQRRLLRRRLRYPVYTGDELSDLSNERSEDGTGFVFTGGFGQTDIWHTLGKALESLERGYVSPVTTELAESGLTLFNVMFRENVRRDMVRNEDEGAKADEHERQLLADEVHNRVRGLHTAGELCDRAAQEFLRAFDLDKQVEQRWSWYPGAGGMLIRLVGMMQTERDRSSRRQAELDAQPASVHDDASANGASVENVGTHSLLAKDSPASDPFRDDAVRLAGHASASVARHLLTRVATGPGEEQGIDWQELLGFYLPFPRSDGATWWSQVLGNPTGDAPQPDVTAVAAQPVVTMLGPGNNPARLAALRSGSRVGELEQYYRAFED